METAFFAANLVKVLNGGWFPLVMGLAIFMLMATWKKGRELVWNKLRPASMPLEMFLDDMERNRKVPRVPGTALFMTANPEGTPIALLHNLKHNKVIHERNLILTILTDEVPQVDAAKRLEVEKLAPGSSGSSPTTVSWRSRTCPNCWRRRPLVRRTDQPAPHHLFPQPGDDCAHPVRVP